ncbi:MAG: hypothetical protein PVH61_03215 [Candidatus Aminicenantes bacterium]|jgi:hypothetical protein
MKCLVIIPTTMHNYSFSAPLAWMFSQHLNHVKGVYGFELTEELTSGYEYFIIELNWFIELNEFCLLVEFIKKNNKNAKILFGGLYAALKYKEIFRMYDVDYFIRGDNELPIKMLLESVPPEKIPNFVGKNFENPITYVFKEEDYQQMDFNLDWFPSYFRYIEKNQMYQLPMIITSKGGCAAVHKECDYCMGAKHKELKKMYNRPPVVMSNRSLMNLLGKIEKKFSAASLQVLSPCNYDFSKQHFDIDINVEIDSPVPIEKISEILYAFKKCLLNISIYEEGLCGESLRKNLKEILQLEDRDHQVRFFAYDREAARLDIPRDHLLHSEDVLPGWTHWNYYINTEQALIFSRHYYYQLEENKKFSKKNKIQLDIQFDLD